MEPAVTVTNREKQDRRTSAIHEAAHLVIGKHFGGYATAKVFRTGTSDPIANNTWVGQCRFLVLPETRLGMIAMGLAGAVATAFDDDKTVESWQIHEWLECDVLDMSDTDKDAATGFTEAEVERTMELVKELWSDIEVHAAELLTLADIEDRQTREMAEVCR